jgi:hypothetical protein
VLQVTVAFVLLTVLVAMDEMTGGVLSTVTDIELETVTLPEVSRAVAVIVLEPLDVAVVSHATVYGGVVTSEPIVTPFTLKVTPATATLSEALAVRLTEPPTLAPLLGAVRETDGAVVSGIVAGVVAEVPPINII